MKSAVIETRSVESPISMPSAPEASGAAATPPDTAAIIKSAAMRDSRRILT